MKKILVIAISCLVAASSCITVFAQGSLFENTQSVTMSKNQKECTVQISIEKNTMFAGAEFLAVCSDNVSIKSISYDVNHTGSAGPILARGYTWFSFFSGSNDFNGKVTATITLEYTKTVNTSIMIDSIRIYTKEDKGIATEELTLKRTIEIKREGATNPIPTLASPSDASSNSLNSNTSPNNDISNNTNSQNTGNSRPDKSSTLVSDNLQNSASAEDSSGNSQIEKPIDNSTSKTTGINTGLLIALIFSICVNVLLLYLYIPLMKKELKK